MISGGTSSHERTPAERATARRLWEVVLAFGKLGLTSFGGPVAHIGYFRAEFVDKRRWINDAEYADLVALCQFLPGPASSQIVFALGMRHAGLAGAIVASLCFTLPSAILLMAFAYGASAWVGMSNSGWLHGLKLAAVAVVAQAVWGMGQRLCPDRVRISICLVAAAFLLIVPGAAAQIGAIASGGIAGWLRYRRDVPPTPPEPQMTRLREHLAAGAALLMFAMLLVLLPALSSTTGHRALAEFDSFYRAGALVFGGGHVVLPLLRAEVVPTGWISDELFLAGYGAAQAIPGPLFTFSAYLGVAMKPAVPAWINGLWCLLAIFLPACLLIGGTLPFWRQLRRKQWAQAALYGANAAVVGILLSALYRPVITESIRNPVDVAAAVIAFGALQAWRLPPWCVVILMASAGQWLLNN